MIEDEERQRSVPPDEYLACKRREDEKFPMPALVAVISWTK